MTVMTWLKNIRAGRSRRDDEGISLAELVVTMFLGSLVLAVLASSFASARGATSGVSARTMNTKQQRVALDSLTKNLRAAVGPDAASATPPFCYARSTAVQFYANTNPGSGATLVRYSVDAAGNLIEQQQPAVGSTVAGCSTTSFRTTRTLANNVLTGGGLFVFRTVPSSAEPLGAVLPFAGSPASLSAADLARVDTISLQLSIQTKSSPVVPASTVTTQVRLPNSKL